MAVIYPRVGKEAETARTLLAMADDVQDVKTNTDNGFAFVVPEYLHDRFVNGGVGQDEQDDGPALPEEVVRRRPGRPRKAQPAKEGD